MWNLFKAQLVAEYTPRTYLLKDLNKLGKHGKYVERLYLNHIDITSGGKIVPRVIIPKAFETYFKAVAIANRLNLYDAGNQLSNQLKAQHLAYWTGRIIDSPTAIIITLYPGIWTDTFFSHNFQFGARKWIDAVSMSMYLQKCSVLGIRISKLPPYIVTPWSGYCFKSLDGGISLDGLVGSILDQFNLTLDLMSSVVYQGDRSFLNSLKPLYANAINSVLTPEIFELANSIPNVYGTEFKGIDFTKGANNQFVDEFILNSFRNICNSFNSQFDIRDGGFGIVNGEKRRIPSLTILTGVLGLDELKKKWIEDNTTDNTLVVDYNEVRFRVAQQYYETYEFYGNRIVRGNIPYKDEFAENEFFQSEYTNYEYRYLLPREYRTRYRLFDRVISDCIDLIYKGLIDGYSVIFNARNIEKQDRNQIYLGVKNKILAKIETDFLEEFDLYADETRSSLNRGNWSEEQNIEYNKRTRELKGITFRNKVFYPDDLLTIEERQDLSAAFDLTRLEDRLTNINDINYSRIRTRLIEEIKDRLEKGIYSYYKPQFLNEDSRYYYSDTFIKRIINAQLQRFGITLRVENTEFNNIFINEQFSLI